MSRSFNSLKLLNAIGELAVAIVPHKLDGNQRKRLAAATHYIVDVITNGAAGGTSDDEVKRLVERFLSWKLPHDFNPDAGISFNPWFNQHTERPMRHEPTGTNLFTYEQAKEMVIYMLAERERQP